MVIGHFFVGLIVVALGAVGLKYNYQLVGFTGHIEWVEKYLGAGSTYFFMKLVAVAVCLGGFLYMFGLFNPVFGWLLSPLARFFHPSNS